MPRRGVAGAVLTGLLVLTTLTAPVRAAERTADEVTTTLGKVIRGEVVEPSPRGSLWVHVRRAWAKAELPDDYARWESAEQPNVRKAIAQRKERMRAWKRERGAGQPGEDRIGPWIDRELERLENDPDLAASALIVAKLTRGQVKGIQHASKPALRLLRLAWTCGIHDPETRPLDDLRDALEGRGYDVSSKAPVAIDHLLPLTVEPESAWRVRRAATEVVNDSGLRLINSNGLVMPEPAAGQAVALNDLGAAISTLKDLLGETRTDPLAARLHEIAARGRSGALVTTLNLPADLSSASVEMRLWVRTGPDQWRPAGARSATVRPEDLGNDAGNDLANDPQVAGAFQLAEALGLGQVSGEIKRRSLAIGAATRKALALARTEAEVDLNQLALPVGAAPVEHAPRKPADGADAAHPRPGDDARPNAARP